MIFWRLYDPGIIVAGADSNLTGIMLKSVKNRLIAKFAGLARSAAGKLSFKESDVSFFPTYSLANPYYEFNLFLFIYRTIRATIKCQHSYQT
jgi:hypothetical protein